MEHGWWAVLPCKTRQTQTEIHCERGKQRKMSRGGGGGQGASKGTPGPLKRGLNVQSSDGHLNKRFRPYKRGIPMSGRSHNAIPSDYSSTGGVSQLRKRRGSGASSFSIPTSCYMKTIERPAKKMREEELPPNSGSSAPLGSDTQSQGEQATTTSGKANSRDSPPSSTRPRKRKFQLVPSRRGIPLILPETPILGYPITVEDYEQVQTDWVKTIFEDKTGEEYGLISHPRDGSLWFYFGLSPLRNPALGFSVDSEHSEH
ncbi:nuclear envelope pore membrane protein POM 121C-like [Manis pentadactyla]|uniref:nuclear envelope pore membrane protein POM 121C-like n=2 Tax=Manis pentadactyla TaxID=143292 RepID=UPI00255CFF27|nr:nuclear envelope pore membrane protein POM 121C-like [Manis pentadactyla]